MPLAFICSLVALFLGHVSWAFVGLLLAVAGLLTSPVLLADDRHQLAAAIWKPILYRRAGHVLWQISFKIYAFLCFLLYLSKFS